MNKVVVITGASGGIGAALARLLSVRGASVILVARRGDLLRVMQRAIRSAGIEPSEVSYINAHGTSTPHGDKVETIAIKRCFGASTPPVSSTKSMLNERYGFERE